MLCPMLLPESPVRLERVLRPPKLFKLLIPIRLLILPSCESGFRFPRPLSCWLRVRLFRLLKFKLFPKPSNYCCARALMLPRLRPWLAKRGFRPPMLPSWLFSYVSWLN